MRNCNCNELVGDIRNREKSPYNTYTKDESDFKFASKEETAEHFETIRTLIQNLIEATDDKASQESLDALIHVVDGKAKAEELAALAAIVSKKAGTDQLDALAAIVNGKASTSQIDALNTLINSKASESSVAQLSASMVSREELAIALRNTISKSDIQNLFS